MLSPFPARSCNLSTIFHPLLMPSAISPLSCKYYTSSYLVSGTEFFPSLPTTLLLEPLFLTSFKHTNWQSIRCSGGSLLRDWGLLCVSPLTHNLHVAGRWQTQRISQKLEITRERFAQSEAALKTVLLLLMGQAAIWTGHTISTSGTSGGDGSKAGVEEF